MGFANFGNATLAVPWEAPTWPSNPVSLLIGVLSILEMVSTISFRNTSVVKGLLKRRNLAITVSHRAGRV